MNFRDFKKAVYKKQADFGSKKLYTNLVHSTTPKLHFSHKEYKEAYEIVRASENNSRIIPCISNEGRTKSI